MFAPTIKTLHLDFNVGGFFGGKGLDQATEQLDVAFFLLGLGEAEGLLEVGAALLEARALAQQGLDQLEVDVAGGGSVNSLTAAN